MRKSRKTQYEGNRGEKLVVGRRNSKAKKEREIEAGRL